MKKPLLLISAIALISIKAVADNEWIHVYHTPAAASPMRVDSHSAADIEEITYGLTAAGDSCIMTVRSKSGEQKNFELGSVDRVDVGPQVPTIYINIENNAEVVDKQTYLNAELMAEGNGIVDDFPATAVSIKGRGNSTWTNFPKKPWRLKFAKKQSLCGLAKAKNFALIANFIDPTNMRNAVAFKLGQMLEMPWTNHCVPVNVVMNGTYRGLYMLTEKVGINSGSVDIDETSGMLWELDANYDEDFKFISSGFQLPVMVKDPDFAELAQNNPDGPTAQEMFDSWRSDFERMEAAVAGASSDDWTDYIDLESLVKYMFVYSLTGNQEPNWPKSVYLHKAAKSEKYAFGPIWDFDWAYTFGGANKEGDGLPANRWVSSGGEPGSKFFGKLCSDALFRAEFKALIERFVESGLDDLLGYIDEYADLIRPASYSNGERWPAGCEPRYPNVGSSEEFDKYLGTLKQFLRDRLQFMRTDSNLGF